MKLSIVAVVIDNTGVTERFISSIRQYTDAPYELILVDNASKNKETIKLLMESADIYYRFDDMADLAKAWNKGIQLSTGKYIAIANNDVIVPPSWFSLLNNPSQRRMLQW